MEQRRIAGHDGTELFVRIVGQGPPLVLCDGIGCDQYAWKYIAEHFRHVMRVVRWNYRGHGRSAPPRDADAIGVEDHARDLVALLDALQIERAILAGHSMGVQVILEAWRIAPQRIAALVPVCGSPGRPLDTFRGNTRFRDGIFPLVYRAFTAPNRRLRRWWRQLVPTELSYRIATLAEINPELVRREDFWPYLEHMARMDMDLFVRMLDRTAAHSAEDVLETIDVPVLVFAGARDRFTPPERSVEMARRIPGAELCIVPGGSHTAPIELPDLFVLRIEKFLRDHGLWPDRAPAARTTRDAR